MKFKDEMTAAQREAKEAERTERVRRLLADRGIKVVKTKNVQCNVGRSAELCFLLGLRDYGLSIRELGDDN